MANSQPTSNRARLRKKLHKRLRDSGANAESFINTFPKQPKTQHSVLPTSSASRVAPDVQEPHDQQPGSSNFESPSQGYAHFSEEAPTPGWHHTPSFPNQAAEWESSYAMGLHAPAPSSTFEQTPSHAYPPDDLNYGAYLHNPALSHQSAEAYLEGTRDTLSMTERMPIDSQASQPSIYNPAGSDYSPVHGYPQNHVYHTPQQDPIGYYIQPSTQSPSTYPADHGLAGSSTGFPEEDQDDHSSSDGEPSRDDKGST